MTKKELLSGVPNVKTSKFIATNTLRVEYTDGTKVIRLHKTDIITFLKNGNFCLNSGTWRTPTTKERINDNCPARISQNKSIWYLRDGNLFYDNCIINSEGKLISKPLNNSAIENKVKKLKKQISDYCNLITKDNLPYPNGGDCFLCSFHEEKTGKSWGDFCNNDNEHLLNHLKEKYLHGSILVNSMRESNYSDMQIGLHYQMKFADTFKRSVRKYLQKRLISNIAIK